jgi:hypothetical protein
MSLAISESPLNAWLQSGPSLGANPEEDAHALAGYVASGAKFLELLGPKRTRSPEQAALASDIHGACRALRRRFMALHADWLYGALTQGFTIRRTLRELVFGAAERCPGLAPTPTQIAQERTLLQSDKEGYEIDQALFFHALLSSQKIGRHIVESARAMDEQMRELIPGAGGLFRLSRQIPYKVAMGYLMTGRHISAERAYELGLVNEVYPPPISMPASNSGSMIFCVAPRSRCGR